MAMTLVACATACGYVMAPIHTRPVRKLQGHVSLSAADLLARGRLEQAPAAS
jgi:hypothetical protein